MRALANQCLVLWFKLRPGHQRQGLLSKESFAAACRRLAYGARQRLFRRELSTEHYDGTGSEQCTAYQSSSLRISPLPKVPLGTAAAVLHC